jgi:hypothetical protein
LRDQNLRGCNLMKANVNPLLSAEKQRERDYAEVFLRASSFSSLLCVKINPVFSESQTGKKELQQHKALKNSRNRLPGK